MPEIRTDLRFTCSRRWTPGAPARVVIATGEVPREERERRYRHGVVALVREPDDGPLWLVVSVQWQKSKLLDHHNTMEHYEGEIPSSRIIWLKRAAWVTLSRLSISISLPGALLEDMACVFHDRRSWFLSRFAPHISPGAVRFVPFTHLQVWMPL